MKRATRGRKSIETVEQRASLMKDDIFKSALDLFEARGFRATSMQDIADACGITKPAIYYYFKNKYVFLQDLYDSVTLQFYSQIGQIAASGDSPDAKLNKVIQMQVRYSIHNRQFQRVLTQERRELQGPSRKAISEVERKYEQLVKDIIVEGQKKSIFRNSDPHLLTMIILGLLGSVHRWASYTTSSEEEIVQTVTDQIFKGI